MEAWRLFKAANEAQGKWQMHVATLFFLTEPAMTEAQWRALQSNPSLSKCNLKEYQ